MRIVTAPKKAVFLFKINLVIRKYFVYLFQQRHKTRRYLKQMKKKIAIIYHPKNEVKYSTQFLDEDYKIVETIEVDGSKLTVTYWEDGQLQTMVYTNMPFLLELW